MANQNTRGLRKTDSSIVAGPPPVISPKVFSPASWAVLAADLVGQDILVLPSMEVSEGSSSNLSDAEVKHRRISGLSLAENWESLGYKLSKADLLRLCEQDVTSHAWLHSKLTPALIKRLGGHVHMKPMYPNFPKQVMEASDAELLFNALLHYAGDYFGLRILPVYEELPRRKLQASVKQERVVRLADLHEVREVLSSLVRMNTVWTPAQADLAVYALPLLLSWGLVGRDAVVPQRENQARITAAWLKLPSSVSSMLPASALAWPSSSVSTTDILRASIAFSGGDPSLASSSEKVRFAKMSRPQRRHLMKALERATLETSDPLTDLHMHRQSWLRLGERLHVGEWNAMPGAVALMRQLRNEKAPTSWRGHLDAKLEGPSSKKNVQDVAQMFQGNPGFAARGLARILRWAATDESRQVIIDAFKSVADRVDTPVLLSLESALLAGDKRARVMLPKGNAAWRYRVDPSSRQELPANVLMTAANVCSQALSDRFARLPALGNVYVEDGLDGVIVPKGLRSASDSVAVVTRGSRLPVGGDANIIRLFLWWTDTADGGRVDVDLSAVGVGSDFHQTETCNFQALKGSGLVHSGDITSAPNGAAEFVDIHMDKMNKKTRYVILAANVYSGPNFSQLPECFVGWQERETGQRGNVMELKTVVDKFQVTAASKGFVGVAFDVKERRLIWLDLPIQTRSGQSVHGAIEDIRATVEDFQLYAASQPKVSRLVDLHVQSRGGTLVNKAKDADVVFSLTTRAPTHVGQVVIAATKPQEVASSLLVGIAALPPPAREKAAASAPGTSVKAKKPKKIELVVDPLPALVKPRRTKTPR